MGSDVLTRARILVVDDEEANVRLLDRLLIQAGYTHVRTVMDSRQVMDLLWEFRPDLILLDLLMPHLDGFAVLDALRGAIPAGTYLPILILTADITPEAKGRALAAGAKDFLTKPFDTTEVLLRIANLLQTRFLHLELARQNQWLEETVRERTEQLLQVEKVATMGSLLAGVAHELNNPLTVLTGHAALLLETAPDDGVRQSAEKIQQAGMRCARIVRNFLALARQHPEERQRVALNRLAEEVVELLAYPLRLDNVEVRLDLDPHLPALWADPHQLHQVLVNLVSNAHQAMRHWAGPRRLTITTRHDREQARVALEVADTGPGIPPTLRAKIFEPFFTTKPAGQGTGLGLSICQGIIGSHAGEISAESPPGQGAVFRIELPVQPPPEVAVEATPVEAETTPQGRKVLVIDDEPEMRQLLAEILGADGHQVDTAGDGIAALGSIEARSYDLILTDVKMPRLDGLGFHGELVRRRPELARRVIFVTGDVLTPETQQRLERIPNPRILKPFDLVQVRRTIRQVLAARLTPDARPTS